MLHSMRKMSDVIDLSLLKSRQRDILEEVFKSWSSDNPCDSELVGQRNFPLALDEKPSVIWVRYDGPWNTT